MIVIFDLDGTIALIDHRRHYVQGKGSKATKEDWRNFYAACVDDEPNTPVVVILRVLFMAGHDVIIFSGRSDEVRPQTEEWLNKHRIPFHSLMMRKEGDYTPDEELKRSWLPLVSKEQILCVFDDRQKVVNMWRAAGLPCLQVAAGDF